MPNNQVDIKYFRYQQQYCDFPWQYPELRNVFLLGGYGCVDGDTLLETPTGQVKIRDFKGGTLRAFDAKTGKTLWGEGLPPVKYAPTELYKVTLQDNSAILCTDKHKFFTSERNRWGEKGAWLTLADIKCYKPGLISVATGAETPRFVVIDSIQYEKTDEYYDLHVPEYHAYIGNGIVNHNCGKTHADRNMLWNIYKRYHNYPVEVIVAGVTITLLRKTLIKMFVQLLNECKIPYKDNSKLNCIQVDKMYFYMLGMDQPENIFAYNGSIFIADELDELPQDTAIEAFGALQERTRIVLPDGRGPFGCISTTAQGLKGVYRITESLKEKKRKYCIIRGATRENTTLADDYLENLESLYDENERMAYLEGKFVNLSSGRVYGNYDEAINMWRGEPIVVKENETVYVGQDFNAGFNKAVAVVDRSGELVAFKEFSFKQISDAPTMLREAFPSNRIVWFPDASGKELLAGYASEIRRANIELRFASFNPSIVERIFFVNKLFKTRRLYITSDCTMLSMALKTRQFDDTGKPEKGKGEKAPDHVCDCFEYVLYRLVFWLPYFRDLLKASPEKDTRDGKYIAGGAQ